MGRTANLTEKERYLIHVDLAHGIKPSVIAKKLRPSSLAVFIKK